MKAVYAFWMTLLLEVFLFSVIAICSYYKDSGENEKETEEVICYITQGTSESHGTEIIGKQTGFGKLKELNADAVGWIAFNDQFVNYPIVQTGDNSYYLNHSFKGKDNQIGCIFMDCRNESFEDRNVVLYGHNMLNRTMFGSLKDVFQEEFWKEEGRDLIWIVDTENYLRTYKIFSYYIIEEEEYYITTAFKDDADYAEFLDVVKARSFRELDAAVTADDHILTLSTCAGTAGTGRRRVVHAKLVG